MKAVMKLVDDDRRSESDQSIWNLHDLSESQAENLSNIFDRLSKDFSDKEEDSDEG